MTDQLTALRELVAKVEAGEARGQYGKLCDRAGLDAIDVMRADHAGYLDAAKALHETLLPGWPFELRERAAWTNRKRGLREPGYLGEADDPARAWLIAVLKAKIAELEATQ